jgi:membrane-associated phospholipid phosphatase
MSREVSDSRCLMNAMAFLLLLFGAAMLALNPDWFDRPLAKVFNSLTRDRQLANAIAFGLTYPILQGVIVVSLVWYCWFSGIEAELRARLVGGAIAAVVAGLIAGLLQRALPTSPKPIFDPVLELHLPTVFGDIDSLRKTSFVNSHSFPSERATMFAGLAFAIFLIRRKLGLLALGCAMAAEISRIYLGLHYPTDIIGSYCLAAAIVWFAQMRWGLELGLRYINWESASPATFYMCAFLACYQMATAFQDLRDLAAWLHR